MSLTQSVDRQVRASGRGAVVVLVAIGVGGLVGRSLLASVLRRPGVQTWTTIFVAISVQAMPFLVLGVTVSGVIASLVPDGWLTRVLPRR